MVYRYVPLLRSKAGEATALLNLDAAAKQRTFPVIHLGTTVSNLFVTRLATAWTGLPLAVDGHFNFGETGSPTDLVNVVLQLRGLGVFALPSMECGAPAAYVAAAAPLAAAYGAVVKVRLGQLPNLLPWLAGVGGQPGQVDLVVQAGHVADFGAGVLDGVVVHALQNLPGAGAWRSVTLAASAAPKDHSGLPLGPTMVPRLDWQLWNAVHNQVPFQTDYSDYGVSHPDMTEPPGYVMGNATVSVRYSLDDNWLVIKGRPVSGINGIPMPVQYRSHSQALVILPNFGGLFPCWGDARIQQIAALAINSGSRQTWVEMSVNRHLSLVAYRLP